MSVEDEPQWVNRKDRQLWKALEPLHLSRKHREELLSALEEMVLELAAPREEDE